MEISDNIKNECMNLSGKYEIKINFNDEDWEYNFVKNINWNYIAQYECLSEDFIEYFEKFQNDVFWYYIYSNQYISKKFVEKYKHEFSHFFWKLKTDEEKENDVRNAGYEIFNNKNGKYILAYKVIRTDNKSFHDPNNYKYTVGKVYESNCDCDITVEDSFGLAAWNEENAIKFGHYNMNRDFKLIIVKIYIKDIGAIIKRNSNKIRCFKFQVVKKLGIYKKLIHFSNPVVMDILSSKVYKIHTKDA